MTACRKKQLFPDYLPDISPYKFYLRSELDLLGCKVFDISQVEPVKYLIGQLIWGRLKGFDWWPGRVISNIEAQKSPAVEGSYWIKWFGDNKISMVCYSLFSVSSKANTKVMTSANKSDGLTLQGSSNC